MSIQWSLVLFTALVGLGSWLFVFVAADGFLKKAPAGTAVPTALIAGAVVLVGGVCSVFHLGNPQRIFNALTHVGMGIFLEMALIGVTLVCIVVFVVLLHRGQEQPARVVGVIGAACAAVLSFAMGSSYLMAARPNWDTVLLPIGYGTTSMAMGAAAWLAVLGARKASDDALKTYGLIAAAFGVVALACVLAYGLSVGAAGEAYLWVAAALGGAAPALLCYLAQARRKQCTATASSALVLALAGAIAFRMLMWVLGTPLTDAFGVVL